MKGLQRFFDILGKIVALVWLVNFVLWVTNAQWGYMNSVEWLVKIVQGIKDWGALLLVAIVGCEAVARRNIVFKILFLIVLAFCVVFMFFPNVSDKIFSIF
ncbi:MAG: hypothetical protein NC132_05780 [Corallococcus sp.]|nr:hypothetical protein [Corallococcus sp.]MCM1360040.1 hypothetical protein [Corallococcus sp.]MCM1395597.1 hypothetical protein [Corallococcus sp.]